MYDFNTVGPGAPMMAPQVDPLKEEKHRKMKATRIGIALFLGSFAAALVGIPTLIICIGFLLLIGAFGLWIAGYVMMIKGGDALPKPHKTLVVVSLIIVIFGALLGVVLGVIASGGADFNTWGTWDDTISGEEIKDNWENEQRGVWASIVTTIFTVTGWALLFYIPSKRWGRITIVVYIVISILLAILASYWQYSIYQSEIDSLDMEKEYDIQDYNQMTTDLGLKTLAPGILGIITYVLLIIIAAGAYINVRNMERELEPKLDPRLYSINM